jgi:hypothetical protein
MPHPEYPHDLTADEIFRPTPAERLTRLYALADLRPETPYDPEDGQTWKQLALAAIDLIRSLVRERDDARRLAATYRRQLRERSQQ